MKKYKIIGEISLFLFLPYFFLFAASGYIESLEFKDTDIRQVLNAIAAEARKEGDNINIVASPEVEGLVTIDLKNIDWRTALKTILKTYNYGYTERGDIITVSGSLGPSSQTGLKMELFKFKYLYADVAKKLISPLLSPDGKVSVLDIPEERIYSSGTDLSAQSMPSSSSTNTGATPSPTGNPTGQESQGQASTTHSKSLVVYDTAEKLDQISTLLSELDVMPKQVLIQAIIMEVSQDSLKDIGFDWGTGIGGATSTTGPLPVNVRGGTLGGQGMNSQVNPSVFNPSENNAASSPVNGIYPYNTGLQVLFQKLSGTKFEVILHALEEDVRTNTLSKPIILTANNQMASILIGTQYPIIQTSSSTQSTYLVGGSLQQYLDVGIQLKVRPQICGSHDQYINLLLHPMVSTINSYAKVFSSQQTSPLVSQQPIVQYPIIDTREAETQMFLKDGETIVMGGLLKNVKSNEDTGVPFLSKIPLLGKLFNRSTKDKSKMDLMIFITAKIVKPGEVLPQEVLETETLKNQFKETQQKDKAGSNFKK